MNTEQDNRGGQCDDDLILLSALNDFLYCSRRAWLHRVEGVFEHSADTLEGSYRHERTDEPCEENRPGVRVVRALPLFAPRLGLVGKADVVEFHVMALADEQAPAGAAGSQASAPRTETPYPVDYKHGRRRQWDNDDVQLCGQALCLEEMFGVPVPTGAIFHIASKHRRVVAFDQALRNDTLAAITGLRRMLSRKDIPSPVLKPQCEGCSLHGLCMPELADGGARIEGLAASLFRCDPVSQEPAQEADHGD
jgi:CRISPR-associated exonuclease Cas4